MMLIYSMLYLVLAVYVERINPGAFGIAQPWYFPFLPSYWRPRAGSTVAPENETESEKKEKPLSPWIDAASIKADGTSPTGAQPLLTISHVTKV